MEKNYNELFEDLIELIEFELHEDSLGYWLKDNQGANLGNIEEDRFETASEIIDRIDVYLTDYFENDIEEQFDINGCEWKDYNDLIYQVKEKSKLDEYKEKYDQWEIDILDMIANHSDEIDLSKCFCMKDEIKVDDDISERINSVDDLNDFYAYCERCDYISYIYSFGEKYQDKIEELGNSINYSGGFYNNENVERIFGNKILNY